MRPTNRLLRTLMLFSLLTGAAACGAGAVNSNCEGDACTSSDLADSKVDATGDNKVDQITPTDGKGDVIPDFTNPPDFGSDQLPPDNIEFGPQPGGFGQPCTSNVDCDSELCITTVYGKLCTETCEEECAEGWLCENVDYAGPDAMWVCIPPKTALCRPCAKDADCTAVAGEATQCVEYGPTGRFCAVECTDTCNSGFECKDLKTVAGTDFKGCRSTKEICPCWPGFVGLKTDCYILNEFGQCTGVASCSADGWETCTAKTPVEEACNGVDDDCDAQYDEGFEILECGLGVCQHTTPGCLNGKPGFCDPYQGAGPEKCNGFDDDCDGNADDLWPDKGLPCDGPDPDSCPNGIFGCSDAQTSVVCMQDDENFPEVCDGEDNDCDGETDEASDLGSQTCGLGICVHDESVCQDGQILPCNQFLGAQTDDLPDLLFQDTNCDGVDGYASPTLSIFVDVSSGNDSFPGTMDQPKKSIKAGLDQAEADGQKFVLVSMGTYNETVYVRNGIGIYGLYDKAAGWSRKSENSTQIKGGTRGLVAQDVATHALIQGITIVSEAATTAGGSSYGVFAVNSTMTLELCEVRAGGGASGAAGNSGSGGLNGSAGTGGNSGCEYDCECLFGICFCGSCSRPAGGAAGASPCGSLGGQGGNGGNSGGNGYAGLAGSGTGAGTGGGAGSAAGNGKPGNPGADGGAGSNGAGGPNLGALAPEGYTPANGQGGQNGVNGGGGGGGGSGGGDTNDLLSCCLTYGSAGGGGGGGGCGGVGGQGGGGGGGSFGIWSANSQVFVLATNVFTAAGGAGGPSGAGGAAGSGGLAGAAGPQGDGDNQGVGASGGKGGNGGAGGQGGGGGGGPSIGIMCLQGGHAVIDNSPIYLQNPGPGGNSSGLAGANGLQVPSYGCN